jgi:hypothetical protein
VTLTTLEASRLTVLAMTAPQPSLKALAMTLRFVPGGPGADDEGVGKLQAIDRGSSVGISFLRCNGVTVEVAQNQECIELMRQFIAKNPQLWNEDIGV